jgi:GTP-binding protein LepA
MRGCQGALLVIDATQGVQAQTLANYELARREKLKIITVFNKIDANCDL